VTARVIPPWLTGNSSDGPEDVAGGNCGIVGMGAPRSKRYDQPRATQPVASVLACLIQNVWPAPPFRFRKSDPGGAATIPSGDPRPTEEVQPMISDALAI
jgi:hypothetical protein